MPSCECCYLDGPFGDDLDGYYQAMKAHESSGCVCTKPTVEGLKARAGQFWTGEKDSRYSDSEWDAVIAKLKEKAKQGLDMRSSS